MNSHFSRKLTHLTFFSIIFVVLIHSFNSWPRFLTPLSFSSDWYNAASYLQMFISNGLARFVIPALFLISGYLLFYKKPKPRGIQEIPFTYWSKVAKRLRTLILPFIFWNLIAIGILFLVTRIPALANVDPWWKDFSPQRLFLNPAEPWRNFFTVPVNFPLWYLRDLFIFVLISPLFYLAYKSFWSAIPLLGALGALYLTEVGSGNLAFLPESYLFISFEGLFFFALGGFFTRYAPKITQQNLRNTKPSPLAFVLLFLSFALVATKTNLAFTLSEEIEPLYPAMLLMYKGSQILLLISIWMMYDWFFPPQHPIAEQKGKYKIYQASFLIFVIHAPLINVLMEGIGFHIGHVQPPGSPMLGLALYFGLPLILIGLGIGLDYTLRKISKPLHFWLTGGR
jgi:surface polysaccharide O-acyltransferase-like enzyme